VEAKRLFAEIKKNPWQTSESNSEPLKCEAVVATASPQFSTGSDK
jgi:hypothetical protein